MSKRNDTVWMGWRDDGDVQHVAIRGRGKNEGKSATICNAKWITRRALTSWTFDTVPHDKRRPCMLCSGWYLRNGADWRVLLDWTRAQARVITRNTPTEERV